MHCTCNYTHVTVTVVAIMLLPKVLILTISVSAVLAAFVTPNNVSPIKNCCDLGFRQLIFSQTVNKPKVYQFKRFYNNRRSSPTSEYCDTLTDGDGLWSKEGLCASSYFTLRHCLS